ncbi:MAG: N-acetyltransferase [Candidatus Abyssobacteria bacterium SURF_17]|jgi:GNAT superfamily N-acetyltransferase|uniref:N-acetyltransferase n=1 Tax=Candidatus Abyssobacteria bacterium SURF_17 TaxID=2093361 RepID=A0A419ER24_9BACT|nr:MAG: N-acetyltransferase [Candidatus Abyssubacteria bacterium SURF_17]
MTARAGSIDIVRVTSQADMMEFIKFPWEIYRGNEYWVPPIIKEQMRFLSSANPFFQHAEAEYYLARKDGATCGRISVSIDRNYVDFHEEKMGAFGFFEAINDFDIASRLLDTARERLKKKGMDVMRGPFNFTTNHECGLLVDGFDTDPVMLSTYNPPYYANLLETYGLKKACDLYSYLIMDPDGEVNMSYMSKIAEKAAENHVVARQVDLKNIHGEMERVKEVYNNAWSKNWGFVPLTEAEIDDFARHMKHLVIDELAYIGELEGKPIGFLLFLPDYNVALKKFNGKMGPIQMLQLVWNKPRIKKGRLFMMGVHREYHRTGVAAAMMDVAFKNAIRRGFKVADYSWILEDNMPVRSILEFAGAKIYKTHRIYELPLSK